MRIAFLLSEFPAFSETFILNQVRGLLDAGHEVDIFPDGSRPPQWEALEDHERDRIARCLHPSPPMSPSLPLRALRGVPMALRGIAAAPAATLGALNVFRHGVMSAALRLLHRQAPLLRAPRHYDVVHAHFGNNGVLAEMLQCHGLLQGPLIVTFYGYDVRRFPPRGWGNVSYRPMERLSRRILVLSQAMKDELAERWAFPPEKMHIHHLGIDCHRFAFKERTLAAGEPPRLLSTARLVPKKGIEYALRALPEVVKLHPGLRYDVIGGGPLEGELTRLVSELGLSENVRLLGWQRQEQVVEALAQAHLFLCPSVTAPDGDQEGTPTVLMEASAMGLPVLATRHAGIPEVIEDGRTGRLVPERDSAAIAATLKEMLATPARWPEMGRAGRERIEREFDTQQQNARLLRHYSEIQDKG
jgi:colanic acid/amylovoran biosynthesis glycosyltransferase